MDKPSTGIESLTARLTPGRPAVVCYVPLGDPLWPGPSMLDAYADAGVDVLEVGIPSPHPWLDGPEVAQSMARALDAGIDGAAIGRLLGDWRRARLGAGLALPAILWFAYPDMPLDAVRHAAEARVIDALLMIDPQRHAEAASLDRELARLAIARCAFLPWEPRQRDIVSARRATGYVMVQARPGVSGPGGPEEDPAPLVRIAREAAPGRPVVSGFGVSGPADVERLLRSGVDGVVLGSACVQVLRGGGPDGLRAFLRSMVGAARPPDVSA